MMKFEFQTFNVLAHEGHGSSVIGDGNSWTHYLLEPVHAPLWIVLAVATALIVWQMRIRFLRHR